MTILLTGASGFLGTQIKNVLSTSHDVLSLGRSASSHVLCDLSAEVPLLHHVDAVVHAAGKAHTYPKTEKEKQEFFQVNVTGTENLLQALEEKHVRKMIFISSVSVYGMEQGELITEDTPLNGKSPYALSKIQSEKLIEEWCMQRNAAYLILRLPLIVGPNPLGNLKKMIEAISRGRYVRIARGNAKKSMVLAEDIAALVKNWIEKENSLSGIYNLTDGYHATFYELEEELKRVLGKKTIPTIPGFLARIIGRVGDAFSAFPVNTGTIKKITCTFTFSDDKARKEQGWKPTPVLEKIKDYY